MATTDSDTDHHLRMLLDQRAARAHMHARYPSLSDFSDSPSIYSPPFFSPRQMDYNTPPSFTSPFRSSPALRSRDALNDPAASMLDMEDDDDPTPSVYDADDTSLRQSDDEDDDDQDMPRMSLLGPKMRFHSKAPWEVEDDPLEEADESDASTNHTSVLRKGFRLKSPASTSARPSAESSPAMPKSKLSTDSSSSQASSARGALSALGQAGRSQTSLLSSAASPVPSLRKKGSAPSRSQSPRPQHIPSTPVSPHDTTSSYISSNASTVRPDQNRLDAFTPLSRLNSYDSSTSYQGPCHPYANPDLAMSYIPDSPPPPAPPAFQPPVVSRSDSAATVTDPNSAGSGYSFAGPRSGLTSDASVSSSLARDVTPRKRSTTLHGKISSPMAVRRPSDISPSTSQAPASPPLQPPPPPGFTGWTERASSPTFALISLEEARAQRARSGTVHQSSIDPSSRLASLNDSDPEHDAFGISYDHPNGTAAARARARSISAGARAKQALQSMVGNGAPGKFERRESEPAIMHHATNGGGVPGKALKHKKSGFMRLFNKEKEKETPPVPSLAEGFAAYQMNQGPPKPTKLSSRRVPVPSLNGPYNTSCETLPSIATSAESSPNTSSKAASRKPSSNSLRRTPPLSINTAMIPDWVAASMSHDHPASETRLVPSSLKRLPPDPTAAPQSAPPHIAEFQAEFPSLKLRPVSTVFSAKFGEHLAAGASHEHPLPSPSYDTDGPSPTTASTLVSPSPVTPVGLGRPDTARTVRKASSDNGSVSLVGGGGGGRAVSAGGLSIEAEEAHMTIRTLQDQIVAAKQAWQRQIWELEGQVRDLKAEVEDMRVAGKERGVCEMCGRGAGAVAEGDGEQVGVVNRPRPRTNNVARFGNGSGAF
ncbi:hypothetical protein HGRIS_008070 [Hohenbuehelia grisea]|uniref:Uncharacterized protein n=1 Tax=Hohenbuehelia grisea TaxID=104357 RepID=A0ABR3J6W0_9AGAR